MPKNDSTGIVLHLERASFWLFDHSWLAVSQYDLPTKYDNLLLTTLFLQLSLSPTHLKRCQSS